VGRGIELVDLFSITQSLDQRGHSLVERRAVLLRGYLGLWMSCYLRHSHRLAHTLEKQLRRRNPVGIYQRIVRDCRRDPQKSPVRVLNFRETV
jgi:hypothetical protein